MELTTLACRAVGRLARACRAVGWSVDVLGWSVGSACSVVTDKDPERNGTYMPIGDRNVWVSRPRVSYDDVDGIQVDEKERRDQDRSRGSGLPPGRFPPFAG